MFGQLWAETPFPRTNVLQQELHRGLWRTSGWSGPFQVRPREM